MGSNFQQELGKWGPATAEAQEGPSVQRPTLVPETLQVSFCPSFGLQSAFAIYWSAEQSDFSEQIRKLALWNNSVVGESGGTVALFSKAT